MFAVNQKKKFYLDDDDPETSMYFSQQSGPFRQDREQLNSSPSSSQLSTFNSLSNLYQQQSMQRGFAGSGNFQRTTPTSGMSQANLMNIQQQPSPNRNVLGNVVQRTGYHNQISQSYPSLVKRNPGSSNGSLGLHSSFGFPQARNQGDMQLTGPSNFDLSHSEFPSLNNRGGQVNLTPNLRNYAADMSGSNQVKFTQLNDAYRFNSTAWPRGSGGKGAVGDPVNEFSIQQEDFPALPGAQNSQSSSNSGDPSKLSKDASAKDQKIWQKRGIQNHADGTVSNIPSNMVTDQFGMVGLLTFIRAAETDAQLVALAPGIDLTTLGLNLNLPDNLYSTFQSPWADTPCRPQDIDFNVPAEYLTNITIREKLSSIKLNRYGEDLLFFLFYTNPGDVLQLAAAAELYNRDWRYHKDEQVWITRANMDPVMKNNSCERGTYYFFDVQNWRKVPKECVLEYSKLEDRPLLPNAILNAQNQAQGVMGH